MNLWQGLAAAGVGMLKGRQNRFEYERRTKLEDAEIEDRKAREKKADAYSKIKITDEAIIKLASDGNVSAARELLIQRNKLAKDAEVPELPEDITNTSTRLQYEDWAAARTRFGGDESGYEAARGMFADLHGDAAADKWFPKVLTDEAGDTKIQPTVGMGNFLPKARPKQGLLPQSALQGAPAAPTTAGSVMPQTATAQAPIATFNPFLDEILKSLNPAPPASAAPAPAPQAIPAGPLPTLAAPSPITPQVGVAGGQSSMLFAPRAATMAQRDPAIEAAARAAMSAWQAQTPEERALAEKSGMETKQFLADLLRTGPAQGYSTDVIGALLALYNGETLTPQQQAAVDNAASVFSEWRGALTTQRMASAENMAMRTKHIPKEFQLKEEELRLKVQQARSADEYRKAKLEADKFTAAARLRFQALAQSFRERRAATEDIQWAEEMAQKYDVMAQRAASKTDEFGMTIPGDPEAQARYGAQAESYRARGGGGPAPSAKPAGTAKPAGKETDKDFCFRIYAHANAGLKKEMERSTLDFPDLANWLRKQGCR